MTTIVEAGPNGLRVVGVHVEKVTVEHKGAVYSKLHDEIVCYLIPTGRRAGKLLRGVTIQFWLQ